MRRCDPPPGLLLLFEFHRSVAKLLRFSQETCACISSQTKHVLHLQIRIYQRSRPKKASPGAKGATTDAHGSREWLGMATHRGPDRIKQEAACLSDTPSQNDNLRIKQAHQVRNCKTYQFTDILKDRPCPPIAAASGCDQLTRTRA